MRSSKKTQKNSSVDSLKENVFKENKHLTGAQEDTNMRLKEKTKAIQDLKNKFNKDRETLVRTHTVVNVNRKTQ